LSLTLILLLILGWEWNVGAHPFETSTKSPEAQTFFERGVAMLHNFWYDEASIAFRNARTYDMNFAVIII